MGAGSEQYWCKAPCTPVEQGREWGAVSGSTSTACRRLVVRVWTTRDACVNSQKRLSASPPLPLCPRRARPFRRAQKPTHASSFHTKSEMGQIGRLPGAAGHAWRPQDDAFYPEASPSWSASEVARPFSAHSLW